MKVCANVCLDKGFAFHSAPFPNVVGQNQFSYQNINISYSEFCNGLLWFTLRHVPSLRRCSFSTMRSGWTSRTFPSRKALRVEFEGVSVNDVMINMSLLSGLHWANMADLHTTLTSQCACEWVEDCWTSHVMSPNWICMILYNYTRHPCCICACIKCQIRS